MKAWIIFLHLTLTACVKILIYSKIFQKWDHLVLPELNYRKILIPNPINVTDLNKPLIVKKIYGQTGLWLTAMAVDVTKRTIFHGKIDSCMELSGIGGKRSIYLRYVVYIWLKIHCLGSNPFIPLDLSWAWEPCTLEIAILQNGGTGDLMVTHLILHLNSSFFCSSTMFYFCILNVLFTHYTCKRNKA